MSDNLFGYLGSKPFQIDNKSPLKTIKLNNSGGINFLLRDFPVLGFNPRNINIGSYKPRRCSMSLDLSTNCPQIRSRQGVEYVASPKKTPLEWLGAYTKSLTYLMLVSLEFCWITFRRLPGRFLKLQAAGLIRNGYLSFPSTFLFVSTLLQWRIIKADNLQVNFYSKKYKIKLNWPLTFINYEKKYIL